VSRRLSRRAHELAVIIGQLKALFMDDTLTESNKVLGLSLADRGGDPGGEIGGDSNTFG